METHLDTFVVLFTQGTSMTCLKIVQCEPEHADYKFQNEHGRLKCEADKPGSYRRRSSRLLRSTQQEEEGSEEYLLYLKTNQAIKQDCWIKMSSPWNLDWQSQYLFVYCGCLEKESFLRARDLHRTLYDGLLCGKVSVAQLLNA